MNQAQQDKLREASQILTEHFNGFVLVVTSQNAEETNESYDLAMVGGIAKGLGLLHVGQTHLYRLLHQPPPQSPF